MGFGPVRGGGRSVRLVKQCPKGCPAIELFMDPSTQDAEVLGLQLADVESRDCGHLRLGLVVDNPDDQDQPEPTSLDGPE